MKSQPYRVLLAGYDDIRISASSAFLFKRAGCIVDAYCPKRSRFNTSKFWTTWHPADTSSPSKFVAGLTQHARSNVYDWIILIDDLALSAAYDHLDIAVAEKILPICNMEHRALTASKAALSVFSKKYGIRTPAFAIYNEGKDIRECGAEVSYPLLLKVDRSTGGKGVFYCKDEQSLVEKFTTLPEEARKQLLIQSYVAGDNIAVEALYRDGVLIDYAYSRVLRTISSEFSASSIREYSARNEFMPELQLIGSKLGFSGFCNFTFMREPASDYHYLIEADLRPQGWFALARFCSIDFSRSIQQYLNPSLNWAQQLQMGPAITIRYFSRDILWSIRNHDLKNICAWIGNVDGRWKYIPWHDARLLGRTIFQFTQTILYENKWLRSHVRKIKQIRLLSQAKKV